MYVVGSSVFMDSLNRVIISQDNYFKTIYNTDA